MESRFSMGTLELHEVTLKQKQCLPIPPPSRRGARVRNRDHNDFLHYAGPLANHLREAQFQTPKNAPFYRFYRRDGLTTTSRNGRSRSESEVRSKAGAQLHPKIPVQRPVLNRLKEVLLFQIRFAVEIGEGSGDLEDAVVGAGGKVEVGHGLFQEGVAGLVELAMLP